MPSSIAPGYLLTWHTYGTWLHGDDAGSVDRFRNTFGSPRIAPDARRFQDERRSLKSEPLTLSTTSRIIVDNIMRKHCTIRGWVLQALAVRSNHVHVVIRDPLVDPETIMKQLKEWGTRQLRAHRIVGPSQPVWTDHGSTIYLYEPGSVEQATRYVLSMQDEPPQGHGRTDWDKKLGI